MSEPRILHPAALANPQRPPQMINIHIPPSKMPVIYLAGAIRDGNPEDVQWRETLLDSLKGMAVFLNPLGGKTQDASGDWTASGYHADAKFIVKQDIWCIRRADIVIFNFRALSQGYPNIGTLVEFGAAVMANTLIYSIIDPDYKGHQNERMYKLHPFLAENSAALFATVNDCQEFLKRHLPVISGVDPHYKGDRV